MNIISFLAFQDELEKLGFNVMESAAKEGIELAKKLKAKNVVPKAGNALKDYMHHMDLSAHPRFAQKMKTTVQGGMPKAASVGETLKKIYHSDKALHRAQGFAAGTTASFIAGKLGKKVRKEKTASALTDESFEKLAQMKLGGIPKGLKNIAETAFDTAGELTKAQQYAASRSAAHIHGKGLGAAARDGSMMSKQFNKRLAKDTIARAKAETSSSYPTSRASRQLQHGIENRRLSKDLLKQSSAEAELEKAAGTPKGLRALANNWSSKSRYALDRAAASYAGHDAAKLLKNKAHLNVEPDAAKHTIGYGKAARDDSRRRLSKEKKASAFAHGAELAGLGLLAAPSVAHMRGKEWSEKNKARAEVGGLGILAAPSLAAAGKAGIGRLKSLASKMPKHALDSSKASMTDEAMNRFADAHKNKTREMAETLKAVDSGAEARKLRLHPPVKKNAKIPKNRLMAGAVATGVAAIGAKKAYDHFKKKKTAAPAMTAMLNMHRLADSARAAKNVAKPMAQVVKKLPSQMEHASRAASLSGHTAVGGHAWNPGAQAKRALSL